MKMQESGLKLETLFFLLSFALLGPACGQSPNGALSSRPGSGPELETAISAAGALQTTITARPVGPNITGDAMFKFKCNKGKCAYKCSLDSAPFTTCKTPKIYSGLLPDAHTFQVKAKDPATQKWDKTPASYGWTIDDGETTFIANSKKIAAGGAHTCILNYLGGVKCWGWNTYGQLGNGKNDSTNVPVNVSGLSSGVSAIAAGDSFNCALTALGGVKCWGYNDDGELGDGTTLRDKNAPVNVSGLGAGVSAITAGRYHACALTTGGGVKCWGWNAYGQIGDGNTADEFLNVPTQVQGLTSGVVAVSAGEAHTCALLATGAVQCWGYNGDGELGNGLDENTSAPISVTGLSSNQVAISAGWYHSCSLNSSSGIKCWGLNFSSQLGDGSTAHEQYTPVQVSGLTSGMSAVASGSEHTCSLTNAGGAKCWGYNGDGGLGNNDATHTNSNVPVDVSGLPSKVCAISSGMWFTCALNCDGTAKCWGTGGQGQLGRGNNSSSDVPVSVSGFVY